MDRVKLDLGFPVEELIKVYDIVKKEYGLIHKSTGAEIHGIKGFLIWDYLLYNEITFKDMDENIVSLYRGFSDKETEDRWDELVKKFGIR